MSANLQAAIRARRAARKMQPGNPLRYAAYRFVTSCEQDLTDDEYATYQAMT